MKIKDTLNLGKTAFPMRAGLPKKEPVWQKDWDDNDLYGKRQALNEGKPSYMLHDGPPYANGNIHIGHSLNKVSKDIIVRYKSMAGFRAPYVPGWDTHGLPIEQQLAKAGMKRKEMDRALYLEECRKYALSQVDKQRKDFKSLGVLGDWEHPYLTLLPEFEAQEIRVFGKMAEKGYIYKGAKPIYWSPSSESSLAEAEIEYHDVKSPSLYVAFKASDTKGKLPEDTEFVIWTTTVWTFPSNRGIFVHPDYTYVLVQVNNRKFLVAQDLLQDVAEKLSWNDPEVLQTIKGSELEYMTAHHPFYDRESLVMVGDYVSLDSGTGLVHSSPNHGEDDYFYSRSYQLPVIEDLDGQGRFNENAPGLEGMYYEKAIPTIQGWLEENDRLLNITYFTHSYPHDWRTKKPVVYRATHNGLLQLINSVKISWTKLNELTGLFHGEKHVSTIWFETVVTGSSHVNVRGEYHCQFSMVKMELQLSHLKRQNMWLNSLKNMAPDIGLLTKRRIFCPKDLLIQVHQMENSPRKMTSWMFGSIQDLLGMVF